MSLNNIQLDPQLLADLYADCLIEDVATTVPEKARRIYLGNNEKKILVVVSNQSVLFLPDNELGFLTSVLTACKLSMADIAIINHQNIDLTELATFIDTQAKTVLLFGLDPVAIDLPINFPQFQLQQFNKRTYLHAPTLIDLETDTQLKKQLWVSLKKLFGL